MNFETNLSQIVIKLLEIIPAILATVLTFYVQLKTLKAKDKKVIASKLKGRPKEDASRESAIPQTSRNVLHRINWSMPLAVFAIVLSVTLFLRGLEPLQSRISALESFNTDHKLYLTSHILSISKENDRNIFNSECFDTPRSFVGIIYLMSEYGGPNQRIIAIGADGNGNFRAGGFYNPIGGGGSLGKANIELDSNCLKWRITDIPPEFNDPLPKGQTKKIRVALIGTYE